MPVSALTFPALAQTAAVLPKRSDRVGDCLLERWSAAEVDSVEDASTRRSISSVADRCVSGDSDHPNPDLGAGFPPNGFEHLD